MKTESRIFEILTIFFFVVAIIYLVIAKEPAGTAALFLTGGLSLIVGTYFRFVSRRLELRPEDNPGAEVSDGAGGLLGDRQVDDGDDEEENRQDLEDPRLGLHAYLPGLSCRPAAASPSAPCGSS